MKSYIMRINPLVPNAGHKPFDDYNMKGRHEMFYYHDVKPGLALNKGMN
jgi:hypothetical protein